MKLNKYIQKICCFYASDWHLAVMLLPYISNEINENKSIFMRCENNIENKMKVLIKKLAIKNKDNIMNIDWNEQVAEENINNNEKIYIVSGSKEFISDTNKLIERYYENKKINIKIVNCYEVYNNNEFKRIIAENNYKIILNTKGENVISENYAL